MAHKVAVTFPLNILLHGRRSYGLWHGGVSPLTASTHKILLVLCQESTSLVKLCETVRGGYIGLSSQCAGNARFHKTSTNTWARSLQIFNHSSPFHSNVTTT